MTAARVAIVGGGISGLMAAMHVAEAGGYPVVFEAAPHPGGRAKTRQLAGFSMNQGPHALYVGGAFLEALTRFGVRPTGGRPDLAKGHALWGDSIFPFPLASDGAYPEPIDRESGAALARFYARVLADPDIGTGLSLAQVLAPLPPIARMAVEALLRLTTYVHATAELDGKAALHQLRVGLAGVIYVDGGWSTLVDGLTAAAQAAGIPVRIREKAFRAQASGGCHAIDLGNGTTETFGAVVLALPPSSAAAMLPTSDTLAARSRHATPVRVVALDLALSELPRRDVNFALGMDEPVYLSVHSSVSELAPVGGALVHIARYLAPNEQPSRLHMERLEALADLLQPGWRKLVLHEQRLSGAVVAHDFARVGRSAERNSHAVDDTPGVFVAGDWVGTGSMLADACASSAAAAAHGALAYASSRLPRPRATRSHKPAGGLVSTRAVEAAEA